MDESFAAFDATLRDGRAVHIRAMFARRTRPSIAGASHRMSEDARYMRFMRLRPRTQPRARCEMCSPRFPDGGIAHCGDGFRGGWHSTSWEALSVSSGTTGQPASSPSPSCPNFGGVGLARTLVDARSSTRRRRAGSLRLTALCWLRTSRCCASPVASGSTLHPTQRTGPFASAACVFPTARFPSPTAGGRWPPASPW